MGLHPDQTFEVVLLDDMTDDQRAAVERGERIKPMDGQRCLVCRCVTAGEALRVDDLFQQADKSSVVGDAGGFIRRTVEALRLCVVDWRHMTDADGRPVGFDRDRIADVLSAAEVAELRVRLLLDATLSGTERKKSASPHTSPPADSANGAGRATAASA